MTTSSAGVSKILVGYDFSANALVGVEQALRIASTMGAEVSLLHARHGQTERMPPSDLSDEAKFDALFEQLLPESRAELVALCSRYSEVPMSRLLIDAPPARGIALAAKELRAGLVVVGTHGRTGFRRFLLGSVAERVIRLAECNVMVAREDEDFGPYRRILVPAELTGATSATIEMALALSSPETQIEVVHYWSVPYPSPYVDWGAGPFMAGTVDSLRTETRDAALAEGEALVARFRDRHPGLSFKAIEDEASPGINKRLTEGNYDLVVMGSHGRQGLQRLLLGSVAEVTARHAPCSVLVVRSEGSL